MHKIILGAALLASSPTVAQTTASTPSGLPEATFENSGLADIAGKIASECMDKGWQVVNQSTNQVTCQVPFSGFKQALAGALLGNAYSTPPNVFAAFNLAQIGGRVRAQARAWMETQMAFGQTRQMQYSDAKSKSGLMSFLVSAGGQLPNGTVFNGTFLGIDNPTETDTTQIHVTHVYHHTPGEEAGLQVGDIITAIDGKTFKTDADFAKRLAKVKEPTYTVTVSRAGQPMTMTVQRRSPPAVGSNDYKSMMAERDQVNAGKQ